MTTLNIPNTFANATVIDPVPMNANFAAVEAAVEASLALDGTVPLTGQLRALAGSAAAPGYAFSTDLDVGMFLKALNELGFTTNGALAFYLDAAKKGWFQGAVDVAGVLGVTGAATLASTLTMSNATNRATFAESLAQVGAGFGAITGISTAATVSLATITSRYAVLNGTGTVTSFGNSGSTSAGVYLVKMGAAITLVHSGALILPNGINITLADNDHVMMRDAGSNVWQVIGVFRNGAPATRRTDIGAILTDAVFPGALIAIIEDQKASGTNGGTFTSGADQVRTLNTLVYNRNTAVALASNQFTLPAGSWEISWRAPAHRVDQHQTILRDITAGVDLARGSNARNDNSGNFAITESFGTFRVTLAGSNVYELRHRCQTTFATQGFGAPNSFGTEVYTSVIIRAA